MFPIIKKPVNWFAMQINWLVPIWLGTLIINGLKNVVEYILWVSVIIIKCGVNDVINFVRPRLTDTCLNYDGKQRHWNKKYEIHAFL